MKHTSQFQDQNKKFDPFMQNKFGQPLKIEIKFSATKIQPKSSKSIYTFLQFTNPKKKNDIITKYIPQ